jgi:hypothetical protein
VPAKTPAPRRRLRIVVLHDSAPVLKMPCQPFVITTRDKRRLERAVGATSAIEVSGRDADLRLLLEAVEAATNGVG